VAVIGGRGIESEFNRNESEIAYHNFVDSFKSEATKKMYVESFDSFLEFLQLMKGGEGGRDDLSFLLQNQPKDIENSIIAFILKLRKEGYAYSSINTMIAGINYFFFINDIVLNKKKISR
jgi:hypothetical protein